MNPLQVILLFLMLWLGVFAQTQFELLRSILGVPLSFIPALVVYAAFTQHLAVLTTFTIMAGLAQDSLSGSRLGVSVAPLFAIGFFLHTRKHLLLRDQVSARFWIGLAAGAGVPLATCGLLFLGARQPSFGWGTIWQLILLGAFNGIACPLIFHWFDHMRRMFEYQPVQRTNYNSDRELKRGRF
jgi:cell shape-determining protein MreD